MEVFIPEFEGENGSAYMDALERELRLGIEQEKVNYGLRQALIQDELRGQQLRTREGLGQLSMVIDARTYFRWHMKEPGCWQDKGFVERFKKDNPECVAPRPEMKTTVLVG